MGVDNAAAFGKGFVQLKVGGGVAGRLPFALHDLAVQIDHHHVLNAHTLIFHARGLDDEQTAFPVDTGDIAPGKGHEIILRQE